jgi:hypothetical protein
MRFVEIAPPSDEDVLKVLSRIVARLDALLRPRLAAARDDARPLDPLGTAQAEAMNSLGTGLPDNGRARKRVAYLQGFSLHAAVHLHENDREGLAHLCGYGARPPFSQERLSQLPDGRLAYRLKRPLGDGRTALLLEPATPGPPPRNPCRIPWAELLLRVFREDVLSCPCGGRRVVLAYLTEPGPVKAILDHLGLPSTGPPLAPARFTAGPVESGWQDDVPELQQSLRCRAPPSP